MLESQISHQVAKILRNGKRLIHGIFNGALLRSGATDDQIFDAISRIWTARDDRYSDERLEAMRSPAGYQAREHKKIEMITLGG